MRISLHDSAETHLLELCNSLGGTPSQVVKLLSKAFNNHINKGQPLELQGVIYVKQEHKQED